MNFGPYKGTDTGHIEPIAISFNSVSSAIFRVTENEEVEGYIEITEYNDLYFLEIMYNYAKIEALVEEKDLKSTIINSCYILSSIEFNDNVIETLIGENVLDYKETIYDIFGPHKDSDNLLDYNDENRYENYNKDDNDSDVLDKEISE